MNWNADIRRLIARQTPFTTGRAHRAPLRLEFVRFNLARPAANRGRNLANHLSAPVIAALLTLLFLTWVAYRWLWQPAWFRALPANWVELFDLYEWGSTVTLIVLWGMVVWWQRRRGAPNVIDVAALYALSPPQFEQYVGDVFRRKGYRVSVRGRTGDMGVDLEITQTRSGKRAIVQCKRYRNTVGPDTVRELYGTLLHELVSHAFLVTTADISDGARDWAADKPLTLIDGKTLVAIARELDVMPDPIA